MMRKMGIFLLMLALLCMALPAALAQEVWEEPVLEAPPATEPADEIEIVAPPKEAAEAAPEGGEEVVAFEAPPEFLVEDGVLTAYHGAAEDVAIPEGVTAIAAGAFAGNHILHTVTCPEGLARIEGGAFRGCDALWQIRVGAETLIEAGAFDGEVSVERAGLRAREAGEGQALQILEQPQNVTMAEGYKATFSVVAAGEDLSYQWQYQKPGTTAWINASGAQAVLPDCTSTVRMSWNGRRYRCIVRDG